MRGRFLTTVLAAACLCSLPVAPARADDAPSDDPQEELVSFDGAVRAGWRLLTGRGRGRFLQDVDLDEGPRIFDAELRVVDGREGAVFDEMTARAHDVGERSTDASIALRRGSELLIDGTYYRDLFTYRADGDPFPRDTTRERWSTRVRYAPQRGLTLRFAWDRSDRSGQSIASADTNFRELPPPAGVDADLVTTKRPFDETFDTLTLGADATTGDWRFGLTTSWRRGRVDDERHYDVSDDARGSDPVRESLSRRTDSTTTTVVGKVGRTFLDGAIESTLFLTYARQPVDGSLRGDGRGVDNAIDGGSPRGAFRSTNDGDTDLRRTVRSWELESVWQATERLEVLLTFGQEDVIDDAEVDLTSTLTYQRPGVSRQTTRTERDGRTTNRMDRAQVDVLYELTDDVDLRGGYERFEQDTKAPFETQGDALTGSTLASVVERFTVGVDVTPAPRLKLSVLARRGRDDDPPAAPSPETADELLARVRWTDSEALTLAAVYRYRGFHQNAEYDSSTQAESASLTATWGDGPFTIEAAATRLTLDTATDTSFFVLDAIGFRQIDDEVAYRTRDLVLSLHTTVEITTRIRATSGGHLLHSRGEEDLDSHEWFATLEHDLSETVTAGLTGRVWRYDERDTSADDYDAEALEIWLELRF